MGSGWGVRFLTFSCYRRLPLLGHPKIRDLFAEQLARTMAWWREADGLRLMAWVVMPEHVHLVVATGVPREGVSVQDERRYHYTSCRGTQRGSVTRMLYELKKPTAAAVLGRWREMEAPILGRLTTKGGRTKFWQPGRRVRPGSALGAGRAGEDRVLPCEPGPARVVPVRDGLGVVVGSRLRGGAVRGAGGRSPLVTLGATTHRVVIGP